MSEDRNLKPQIQNNRTAQVVPQRGSKELSNQIPDRRSSYNMDQYNPVGIDDIKDEEPEIQSQGISLLDKFVILLVVLYTLLVFINFSFTTNDANENSDIKLTLFIAQVIELVILILFSLEIITRIYMNGFSTYFSDFWQIFDAIIIVASITLIILDWELQNSSFKTVSKILRGIFRFLRLFLVFRKFNQVKTLSNAGQRYKVRSPVEKVIEILRDLADTFEDANIIKEINTAVSHITNNTLYEPILEAGSRKNEILLQWHNHKQENEEQQATIDVQIVYSDVVSIPQDLINDFDSNILNLEYDYFSLYDKVGLQMLVHLLNFYFVKNKLFSQLRINPETFTKFAEQIAKGYHADNPYHNVIHAFDVTHTMYFYIEQCEFKAVAKLTPLDYAIMLLAAAAHDLDHPGLNNIFLSNTRHPLALTYNDKSPLEQHHSASLFQIIKDLDLLKYFSNSDYKYFREKVISMILSTDNAMHGKDYNKLKVRLSSTDFDPSAKDKGICMDSLLHGADISNPFKPIKNYQQWTVRVLNEFWLQGDQEKQLGLPVTMLCDRKTTNTAKSQVGFIDFMVQPYYLTLAIFLPKLNDHLEQIQVNKKFWQEKIEYYQEELNKQI